METQIFRSKTRRRGNRVGENQATLTDISHMNPADSVIWQQRICVRFLVSVNTVSLGDR